LEHEGVEWARDAFDVFVAGREATSGEACVAMGAALLAEEYIAYELDEATKAHANTHTHI
jgi:hypothetical protein